MSADTQAPIEISVLESDLSIVRLPADARTPPWAEQGSWHAVTRTGEELSVVCESRLVPPDARRNGPWRALKVAGPLDFGLTGILLRLARPLAEAGISLFAVSTFDTDYVLVRAERLAEALACLGKAGIVVPPAD